MMGRGYDYGVKGPRLGTRLWCEGATVMVWRDRHDVKEPRLWGCFTRTRVATRASGWRPGWQSVLNGWNTQNVKIWSVAETCSPAVLVRQDFYGSRPSQETCPGTQGVFCECLKQIWRTNFEHFPFSKISAYICLVPIVAPSCLCRYYSLSLAKAALRVIIRIANNIIIVTIKNFHIIIIIIIITALILYYYYCYSYYHYYQYYQYSYYYFH